LLYRAHIAQREETAGNSRIETALGKNGIHTPELPEEFEDGGKIQDSEVEVSLVTSSIHSSRSAYIPCHALLSRSLHPGPAFELQFRSCRIANSLLVRNRVITVLVALSTLTANILSIILCYHAADDSPLAASLSIYLHLANIGSVFGLIGALRVCSLFFPSIHPSLSLHWSYRFHLYLSRAKRLGVYMHSSESQDN
jgi:hypothetical protein